MPLPNLLSQFTSSLWVIAFVPVVVWLFRDPMNLVVKARELRQKDVDISMRAMKELQLSAPSREVVAEAIERYEFKKATGVSLEAHERGPLASFVRANRGKIRWLDIDRAKPYLSVVTDVVDVRLSLLDKTQYWLGKSVVFFLLALACGAIVFSFLYTFANKPHGGLWLAYGLIYLLGAAVAKISWLSPFESAVKIRKHINAASPQPTALEATAN